MTLDVDTCSCQIRPIMHAIQHLSLANANDLSCILQWLQIRDAHWSSNEPIAKGLGLSPSQLVSFGQPGFNYMNKNCNFHNANGPHNGHNMI